MNFFEKITSAIDSFYKNQTESRAERVLLEKELAESKVHIQHVRDALREIIPEFEEALHQEDLLTAAQKLGVLQFFGHPDYDFLLGEYYLTNKNYLMGIEQFKKIPSDSPQHMASLTKLAICYSEVGDFFHLIDLLASTDHKLPSIAALFLRLRCIGTMKLDDFMDNYDRLQLIEPPLIEYKNEEDHPYLFFVCVAFAEYLVFALECIYEWDGPSLQSSGR